MKKNNLPEKVERVCQAVVRLRKSGQELTTLKVSDIAKEAGIGKGTIYDYFSTKEDIFLKALSYEYWMELDSLRESILSEKTFRDKVYSSFHWVEKAMDERSTVLRLARRNPEILEANREFCKQMGIEIKEEEYINSTCDDIFGQGVFEGVIRAPKDCLERDIVISSVLCGLSAYLVDPEKYETAKLEDVEEMCYQNLLRLLPKNS